MSNLSASCLFDINYIEPALVTLKTILNHEKLFKNIYIIYLKKETDNDLYLEIIRNFAKKFDIKNKLKLVEVQQNISEFNSLHFSNAIIYKILIPEIVQNEEYIINIDAGNIILDKFEFFINYVSQEISLTDFTIGCFLSHNNTNFPLHLPTISNIYPSANFLLFNIKAYKSKNLYEKITTFYASHLSQLKYAEQEILPCVLDSNCFLKFKYDDLIYLDDLIDFANNNFSEIDIKRLNNSIAYKNHGSIKPWKLWNLNPRKFIYLNSRKELDFLFENEKYKFIHDERTKTTNSSWPIYFYKSYENFLLLKKNS